jgi:hypothetical protein
MRIQGFGIFLTTFPSVERNPQPDPKPRPDIDRATAARIQRRTKMRLDIFFLTELRGLWYSGI